MKKNISIGIVSLIVLAVLGYMIFPKISQQQREHVTTSSDKDALNNGKKEYEQFYYTCPMHPFIHKDAPGACPVCGMTLIKKTQGVELSSTELKTMKEVSVSPSRQVLANVSTAVARRLSLNKEIRAVGTIDYAEPNLRHISIRFAGRIEKLHVTFTGQHVRKSDPVADVYSPEAVSAQQEYLLAKDSYDQVKDANEMILESARSLLERSKEKLSLWGFTEKQLQQLDQTKQANRTITIYSPISGTVTRKNAEVQQYVNAGENLFDIADLSVVWLNVDVYESEIHNLSIGQRVEATSDSYPDEVFIGKINFINPVIETASRTVKLRSEFTNVHEKLKPEMFLTAVLKIPISPAIVIPSTAVISTGTCQIVWVQKQEGVFEPRVVHVGQESGNSIQILSGLEEGETIVISGGYLIDSESQLQASQGEEGHSHD